MKNIITLFFLGLLLSLSFNGNITKAQTTEGNKMELKSASFAEGKLIPSKYTCDGENISPQLSWNNFPDSTKEFAIIADDPDAPAGTWVHWVIYNIPVDITELSESFPIDKTFKNGITQGTNDFRKIGYGGPCPPNGTHIYYFKIYALDKKLELKPGLTKKELLERISTHVISETKLMGKYSRTK